MESNLPQNSIPPTPPSQPPYTGQQPVVPPPMPTQPPMHPQTGMQPQSPMMQQPPMPTQPPMHPQTGMQPQSPMMQQQPYIQPPTSMQPQVGSQPATMAQPALTVEQIAANMRSSTVASIGKHMPASPDTFPMPMLLLPLLGAALKGLPDEAFRAAKAAKKSWLLGLIFFSVIGGLMQANFFWRVWSGTKAGVDSLGTSVLPYELRGSFMKTTSEYLGFGFPQWLSYLLLGALISAACYMVGAAALYFVASIRGNKVPFTEAASAYMVTSLPAYGLATIAAILWLIPSAPLFGVTMMLIMLVYPLVSFCQILWGFEWLRALPYMIKSPAVPYALFLGLATFIDLILFYVITSIV